MLRELEGKEQPSVALIKEILSERYGWLPSQIEGESFDAINEYLTIIELRAFYERAQQKKQRYGSR